MKKAEIKEFAKILMEICFVYNNMEKHKFEFNDDLINFYNYIFNTDLYDDIWATSDEKTIEIVNKNAFCIDVPVYKIYKPLSFDEKKKLLIVSFENVRFCIGNCKAYNNGKENIDYKNFTLNDIVKNNLYKEFLDFLNQDHFVNKKKQKKSK